MEHRVDNFEDVNIFDKNIILVGFMGAGKSAVGKALSGKLSLNFYDSDEVIEARAGMAISDIFQSFGERYFREMEHKVIRDLLKQGPIIISTGGGAVMDRSLLDLMLSCGIVIYLDASIDTLYERLEGSTDHRPMLHDNDLKDRISQLYIQRRPLYNRAHYTINTNNKSIYEVAEEIKYLLETIGPNSPGLTAERKNNTIQ